MQICMVNFGSNAPFKQIFVINLDVLHDWNGKVESTTLEHGMELWSNRSLTHYWKLAMHRA